MISEHDFQAKYAAIFPRLDAQQRRLIAAADALFLGRGGVATVERAAGLSRTNIHRGRAALEAGSTVDRRVRQVGGGRKRIAEQDPVLVQALEALVEPLTRGDPLSPWRWTCNSTRQLAEGLRQQGPPSSAPTVAALWHDVGDSLPAKTKTLEGRTHPDRDRQFQSMNTQVKRDLKRREPVISVDTNKKELVGPDKTPGQEWSTTGQPRPVNVHDFPDKRRGKAMPDGIDDRGQNVGWVHVGGDHDTSSVAIESLRRWWEQMGQQR